MIRALLCASLLAFAAAADDALPDDPAKPVVQRTCLLCHSGDYLTQQRLSEGQWQKTIEKMRKFGSPATDEEAKLMTAYLAKHWNQQTPPPQPPRSGPPAPPRKK